MGKYRFVSNRILKNSKGEEKGKMRVLVLEGSETAQVDYNCPECGFSKHIETKWKRPFSVTCEKCKFVMRLPRLKDEIKREKKLLAKELEAKLK
ncbi:MAG: hypothetical protein QW051_02045 [Candidatus Aenigmatarchaeota archaeon]